MRNPNPVKTAMIRAAVEKGIKDMKDNPRRGIRNLVELGEMFAGGRFQKDFFATVMAQLRDERSAYYQIAEQVVQQVDAQILTTFGINMGYNALSHGAAIIREIEEAEAFNIPWCLTIDLGHDKFLSPSDVGGLIDEGKKLGIYSYQLCMNPTYPDTNALLLVLGVHKACAFSLFCSSRAINGTLCKALRQFRNLAVLIDLDEPKETALSGAAKRLRDSGALYGGVTLVPNMKAEDVNPGILEKPQRLGLPFVCFVRKHTHHPLGTDGVYRAFVQLRKHLKVPVIPLDFYEDIAHVDRIISSEACLASITGDGSLLLVNADRHKAQTVFPIGELSLKAALLRAMPKGGHVAGGLSPT